MTDEALTRGPSSSGNVPAVSARGFGYRHAGRKAAVLNDITLDIERGEKVLLLGASGMGKSTLLAAIAGVLGDDSDGEATGKLLIEGRTPASARGAVGLVLQDPDSQTISARVGDDVAFGAENLGVAPAEIGNRVRASLDLVGLDLPLDHPTHRLSGGQKQRLALAGVLAMGARVICLDEPTANIDPAGVPVLRDAAITAAERTGAALIVVEHRVDAWVDVVDRIIVLGRGGVIADGAPHRVLEDYGQALTDAGVWIPGAPPALPDARSVACDQDGHPSGDIAIETRELDIGYGAKKSWFRGGEAVEPIARDVSVSIPSEASTCIVGRNGSGKSTLALTLGGLLEPMAGTVQVAGSGSAPWKWPSKKLATRIGTVFQDPEHQFVTGTVLEELQLGPKLVGVNADKRIEELLERLRLTALTKANPFSLSGGEKRRLSVATMLATAPDIVLLDEPTFGQDRRTFTELLTLLRQLADDGRTVISITHDPLVVQAMGDYVVDMDMFHPEWPGPAAPGQRGSGEQAGPSRTSGSRGQGEAGGKS
ncbi:ABC transporter ATP-binding protein [Corynebacterium sp. LK30]|uniref:ABC transporter ATP-binding protein n=1 Tax=Corynebacterium sp. LK30 TaxID=2044577 RepID=UPI001651D9B5|nr:ABC transporter ATP-binding protein [Corynebacterium sp. LK30]MBC6806602.1 ABC transporter ATP-binding protein [Corynebacterium sp. LK30]